MYSNDLMVMSLHLHHSKSDVPSGGVVPNLVLYLDCVIDFQWKEHVWYQESIAPYSSKPSSSELSPYHPSVGSTEAWVYT